MSSTDTAFYPCPAAGTPFTAAIVAAPEVRRLKRLVYASQATLAQTNTMLEALVGLSRSRNQRCDVSGFLFYVRGRFLQCLEGPADSVDGVYARIQDNPRHHGLVLLLETAIDRLAFEGQDMVCAEIEPWSGSGCWPPAGPPYLGPAADPRPRPVSTCWPGSGAPIGARGGPRPTPWHP